MEIPDDHQIDVKKHYRDRNDHTGDDDVNDQESTSALAFRVSFVFDTVQSSGDVADNIGVIRVKEFRVRSRNAVRNKIILVFRFGRRVESGNSFVDTGAFAQILDKQTFVPRYIFIHANDRLVYRKIRLVILLPGV